MSDLANQGKLFIRNMKKKASTAKSATPKKTQAKSAAVKPKKTKETELIAIEIPMPLVKGMELVGITNREEYISFLISSSLLNYSKYGRMVWTWKRRFNRLRRIQIIRII
jgi:hypothetical protein